MKTGKNALFEKNKVSEGKDKTAESNGKVKKGANANFEKNSIKKGKDANLECNYLKEGKNTFEEANGKAPTIGKDKNMDTSVITSTSSRSKITRGVL